MLQLAHLAVKQHHQPDSACPCAFPSTNSSVKGVMCLKNFVNSSSTIDPMVHRTKPSSLNPETTSKRLSGALLAIDEAVHTYNANLSPARSRNKKKVLRWAKGFILKASTRRRLEEQSSSNQILRNLQVRLGVFEHNHHISLRPDTSDRLYCRCRSLYWLA